MQYSRDGSDPHPFFVFKVFCNQIQGQGFRFLTHLIESEFCGCFAFCFPLATTMESKSANEKSNDHQPVGPVSSTTTTSNAESSSSTPMISEELKLYSNLRKFTFNDLKLATRNFRPESLLGEGGFGCVFKGWIEENGTAPVKPGTGLTVAVKTLNPDGLQGHKEWLVSNPFLFCFVLIIHHIILLF